MVLYTAPGSSSTIGDAHDINYYDNDSLAHEVVGEEKKSSNISVVF